MTTIHGHFDGKRVVLDEPLPVALAVGQRVRVILDSAADPTGSTPPTSPKSIAERTSEPSFSPHADPVAALMQGEPFDERDALAIDPLDAVPSDFVRNPGSAAGEITISDDFDETPKEFKDYL